MLLFAIIAALAAEPTESVHGVGALSADGVGGGVGGTVGLNLERLDLELAADAAFGSDAIGFVRPQLRVLPWGPQAVAPHLVLGGGVQFAPTGDGGALSAGLGIDLQRTAWRPRVQVMAVGFPGEDLRGLLTIGLAHRRIPSPYPTPVDRPRFDAAMVWVPGPVCQWLPSDEASEAFVAVDADATQVSTVPRPSDGPRGAGEGDVGPMGDLVVAASPGDRVTVDERALDVATDGIAWASVPEGPATIRVVGGGRREVLEVAVSANATLWVGPSAPEPVELRFELGSAELEGPSATRLDAFADTLGDWHVQVWGSYSLEGDLVANQALAMQRAESARERLVLAGVPSDQVRVLPARRPETELAPEAQRVAVLLPVVPEEAP
jgi:hypothetical protein